MLPESILIKRSKLFFNITEIFFENNYETIDLDNCDIFLITQSSIRTKASTKYTTLQLDLKKNEDILRSEIHKNTRTKISRCERRDELITTIIDKPSEDQVNEFVYFFNQFSKMKNLAPANENKLYSLNKIGALSIGLIKDGMGETLAAHSHIVSTHRARLLYSSSLYRKINDNKMRNLIGRANRLLHWNEIIYFKNISCKVYDFGGLSDSTDRNLANIDEFKKGFGGEVVVEYNQRIGISILGKFIIFAYKLIS